MTIETILLSGISAVTSGLVYVTRLLWVRAEACERDRYALREEIEELKLAHGIATGRLSIMERCPEKSCPYKSPARYDGGKAIGKEPA